MSHFGDLLKGVPATTTPPEPVAPVVAAPVAPVAPPEPHPMSETVIPSTTEVPTAVADIPSDLKWLSKIKLEEIGRGLGIELDRRLSQPKLVEQLEEHIANINT